jgi:hypothetical protein
MPYSRKAARFDNAAVKTRRRTGVHTSGHDPPTDDSRWFYRHRGVLYGPVSATDLRAAAHLGFLKPRDAVLRHGETA